MKQLTWREADNIAQQAAVQSLGFGPRTGKVQVTAEEVIEVAKKAAFVALQLAGNLDKDDAADAAWHRLQAARSPSIA